MVGETGTTSEPVGLLISRSPRAPESVVDESGVNGPPRSLGVPPAVETSAEGTASRSWLSVAWMESNVHASSMIFHVEMDI